MFPSESSIMLMRNAFIIIFAVLLALTAKAEIITIAECHVTINNEALISARDGGFLDKLLVREGDIVKSGKLLGTLDDEIVKKEHEKAAIEHNIAKETYASDVKERYAQKTSEVAKNELRRATESRIKYPKVITQTEYEKIELSYQEAILGLEQAVHDRKIEKITIDLKKSFVDLAQINISRRQIISSANGMIVEILQRPGKYLNLGDPIMRITEIDKLRVTAFLDSTKYGQNLKGCNVKFDVKLPGSNTISEYTGKIIFVKPEIESISEKIEVWAEIDNPKYEIMPGMLGTLKIDLNTPRQALLQK